MNVLVVDDNDDFRFIMKMLLSQQGIVPDLACHGEEAVERCTTTKYDIVFIDMIMPGMDGLECVRQVRKHLPQSAIYALSAGSRSEERTAALEAGFDEYYEKPMKKEMVKSIIDQFKQRHGE